MHTASCAHAHVTDIADMNKETIMYLGTLIPRAHQDQEQDEWMHHPRASDAPSPGRFRAWWQSMMRLFA
jgi:hypothetical protein